MERVELSAKQRQVAEHLQLRLLPSTLPVLPRLTTTARYLPATVTSKVGGDRYDVIELPGERMALVVGDVEGHARRAPPSWARCALPWPLTQSRATAPPR